ncbi:MAG: cupin domain-containing protein [Candidatus Aminicenantaceae bacterium]|jgi:quercetin dioxygenase-like cupin family protein
MEELKSQVLDLARLLEYQQGSIVSRELLSLKTGTLTVFAFDKDQGLSEHTAPFDATVLGVEGSAEITISGAPHTVRQGELIIMPAHQPHALKAIEPFKMLLIMIRT